MVKIYNTASQAIKDVIKSGMTILAGGFGLCGIPENIIAAIADMDADVISIETSRSQMELLNAFVNFKYPNEIGPGVYDIHSPRVPKREEMEDLLRKALDVLKPEQIWVNPDCGLKTRDWPETKSALKEMVEATKSLRAQIQ